jgi:hypothetical protein
MSGFDAALRADSDGFDIGIGGNPLFVYVLKGVSFLK